jgi:hypothetical protein
MMKDIIYEVVRFEPQGVTSQKTAFLIYEVGHELSGV